ncbi:MAG: hypothetical protein Q8R79_08490, partial [Legionellaceae bacterium]|nr:hypothetical protein [Legionellaceae bacterium]
MPVPRPLIAEKTPVGSVINERLLDINNYVYDLLKKASFTPQECKSLMRKPEHIRQNTEEGINQYANRILGLGVLVSLRLLRPSLTAVANALQINGLFGGYELSVPVGAVTAVLNATDPTTAAALLYYLVM